MTARQSLVLLLQALLFTTAIQARGLNETAVADMSIGAAPGYRELLSLASDGDHFFAVWTDSRDEELAIRGARFDTAGNGLDPIDFIIATVHTLAAHAAVAWTGESYFVVWSDLLDPAQGTTQLLGVTVDRNGRVLETPTFLAEGNLGFWTPVASNGLNIIVGTYTGYLVLDVAGRLLANILLDAPQGVARRGSGYLLFSSSANTTRVIALDENGTIVRSSTFPDAANVSGGTCNDSGCLVVVFDDSIDSWFVVPFDVDGRPNGPRQPVSEPGTVIGSQDRFFFITPSQVLELDASGKTIASRPALPGSPDRPIVATSNGTSVAASWIIANEVRGVPLAGTAAATLSRSAPAQTSPQIAFSGSNYLVAWLEKFVLRAGRVQPDGTRLDGAGVVLSTTVYSYPQAPVRVVFDGDSYVVVWQDNSGSYYQRIPVSGAIDTARIALPIKALGFDIATNGEQTILVWSELVNASTLPGGPSYIKVARIGRDGAIGPPNVVATSSGSGKPYGLPLYDNPAAAWNGTAWVLAWQYEADENRFPDIPNFVSRAILTVALDRETLAPLRPPFAFGFGDVNTSPHIAGSGQGFLVAWTGGTALAPVAFAQYFSSDGQPLDRDPRMLPSQFAADAVWDGHFFDVATTRTIGASSTDAMLFRLPPFPGSESPIASAISVSIHGDHASSLVRTDDGEVVAAYTRYDEDAGGVQRAFIATPRGPRVRAVRR